MARVIRFEEHRSGRWVATFIGVVVIFSSVIIASLIRSYGILSEQHTFDVLEILAQDREIIAEFWQDTFLTLLEELPQGTLVIGLGFIALFIGIWVGTHHRRKILKRRLLFLAKRQKSSENKGKDIRRVL